MHRCMLVHVAHASVEAYTLLFSRSVLYLRLDLSLNLKAPASLDWLVREPRQPVSAALGLGLQMNVATPSCLHRHEGLELRSLCLCSKQVLLPTESSP